MTIRTRFFLIFLTAVATVIVTPSAAAWGCRGHQVVALIAEKYLNRHARDMAMKILAASPISPDLRRYCGESGLDPFADSSTWADDERSVQPETGPWHYIDIPLGISSGKPSAYCPPKTGCVTTAIAAQLVVLRNPNATAQNRADALRFVIHFIGDLHQPLHTTTNNDLGGNCVPVAFEGHDPEEMNAQWGTYRPNLHAVWDTGLIDQFWRRDTPQEIADRLEKKVRAQIPLWESGPVDVSAWIWQSHRLAQRVAYGRLPVKVATEKPKEVESCSADDHISDRLYKLHEQLGSSYDAVADAAIHEQLARAGARLADVLNSLWPALPTR